MHSAPRIGHGHRQPSVRQRADGGHVSWCTHGDAHLRSTCDNRRQARRVVNILVRPTSPAGVGNVDNGPRLGGIGRRNGVAHVALREHRQLVVATSPQGSRPRRRGWHRRSNVRTRPRQRRRHGISGKRGGVGGLDPERQRATPWLAGERAKPVGAACTAVDTGQGTSLGARRPRRLRLGMQQGAVETGRAKGARTAVAAKAGGDDGEAANAAPPLHTGGIRNGAAATRHAPHDAGLRGFGIMLRLQKHGRGVRGVCRIQRRRYRHDCAGHKAPAAVHRHGSDGTARVALDGPVAQHRHLLG